MRMNSVTFSSTNIHAFPTFTWLRTWNHDKTVYLSLGKMSLETPRPEVASSPFARCLWLYLAQKQRGSKTWKWKLDRVTTEKRRDVVQKAPVNMSKTDKRFNEWMYHTCLFKRDLRDIMFNFSFFFFCSCFYVSQNEFFLYLYVYLLGSLFLLSFVFRLFCNFPFPSYQRKEM